MSWEREEVKERLRKLLDDLRAESEDGTVILVEGERDVESLRELGIRGEVIKYRSIRELLDWSAENSGAKLIILTDLDMEGSKIASRVCSALSGRLRCVDTSYMRRLSIVRRLGVHELKDIKSILNAHKNSKV